MRRLFDADPVTKTKKYFREDSEGFGIETATDVTDVVEEAKALYNAVPHKAHQKFKGDGFHHVANVPLSVIAAYRQQTGIDLLREGEEAWKRFLNDSDHSAWRTRPGRI